MGKRSSIIMAMADHLSGEALGVAIEDLMKLGAHGVHASPSVTKKGRPGVILMIEPGNAEEKIADYLARELKIGGYQRVETTHLFHQARFISKRVIIRAEGKEAIFEIQVKHVGPEEATLFVSVEADDVLSILEALESTHGVVRSFHFVKGALESAAKGAGEEVTLDL